MKVLWLDLKVVISWLNLQVDQCDSKINEQYECENSMEEEQNQDKEEEEGNIDMNEGDVHF